jgi:hypothetical protein
VIPPELVDVLAGMSVPQAICLAVALFSGSLVPYFLFVDSRVLTDLRAQLGRAADCAVVASVEAFRDAAALLILLTTRPQGAVR